MKDRILAGFFSVSGVALMVGTAGFLSALVTMFVDVNAAVPVKALLCTVLVASVSWSFRRAKPPSGGLQSLPALAVVRRNCASSTTTPKAEARLGAPVESPRNIALQLVCSAAGHGKICAALALHAFPLREKENMKHIRFI